jgi:hypothetical protein
MSKGLCYLRVVCSLSRWEGGSENMALIQDRIPRGAYNFQYAGSAHCTRIMGYGYINAFAFTY